jgi:hypothetical protein
VADRQRRDLPHHADRLREALANPTLPIPHQVIGARLGLNSRSFSYVSNDAATVRMATRCS